MTNPPLPEDAPRLTRAIVRLPGENFDRGITTGRLGPPAFERMVKQHAAYVQALRELALEVIILEPEPDYPDAHFVEDTAVVLPDLAVISRPGAPARRGEEDTVEPVLARFRSTVRIASPGTLDGGDVLLVGRRVFIGLSRRTNLEGARQLGGWLAERGWEWTTVPVTSGLHLKSSVAHLGGETLLLCRRLSGEKAFHDFRRIEIEPPEDEAANTVWINGSLMVPAGFDRTRKKLEQLKLPIVVVDVSEARKMDGGLSCLSLRF